MSHADETRFEEQRAELEREPGAERPGEAVKDPEQGRTVNGACRSRRGAAIVNRSSGD